MLAITPLFYWLLGLVHSTLNTMAGAGDTLFSMIAMVVMMLLRVALDYVGIWWAFPISWAITLVFVLVHYFRGSWQQKAVLRQKQQQATH